MNNCFFNDFLFTASRYACAQHMIVNCGLLKRAYTHRSIKGHGGDSNNNRDSRDTDDNEPRIC